MKEEITNKLARLIVLLSILINLLHPVYAQAPLVSRTNQEYYQIQLDNELTLLYKSSSGTETYNKIPVLPNGKATIPKLGEIKVEGLSHAELKKQIQDQVGKDIEVELIIYRISNNITVLGAVRTPGSYSITDIKTLYDAIGKAGGFAITANKNKVKLIRQRIDGSREEQEINFPKQVFKAYDQGIGEENYLVKEGDLIWVPDSKLKQTGMFMLKLLQITTIGVISGVVSATIN
jgi:polysaccharide export outer membrane protein